MAGRTGRSICAVLTVSWSRPASLAEVMYARDHGGFAAVQAYERKYGVLAEGSADDWDVEPSALEQMTAEEFETAWTMARQAIEHRFPARS